MGKYELFIKLNNKKNIKVPNTDFELNQNIYQSINKFTKEAQKHGASSMVIDSLLAYSYLNTIIDFYTYNNIYFEKEIDRLLPAIDKYFIKGKELSPADRIKFARFYMAFNKRKEIMELLEPIVLIDKPHHEAVVLYLKYNLQTENDLNTFYPLLLKASKILSKNEWCDMFIGLQHLSYSILENGKIRSLYCKTCGCW